MPQAICMKCGAQLEEGFKFCMKCGAPSTSMKPVAISGPDLASSDGFTPPVAVAVPPSSGVAGGKPGNTAAGEQADEGKKGVFGKLFGRDKNPYSQAEEEAHGGNAQEFAAVQGATGSTVTGVPPAIMGSVSAMDRGLGDDAPNREYEAPAVLALDDDSEIDATIDFETYISRTEDESYPPNGRDGDLDDDYDDEPTTVLVPTFRPLLRRQSTGNVLYFDVPAVIGKGSRATCRVSGNPAISREHVRIEQEGDAYFLTDTSSTNGTWLDGKRLTANMRVGLSEGSILTLADEDFTFALEEE